MVALILFHDNATSHQVLVQFNADVPATLEADFDISLLERFDKRPVSGYVPLAECQPESLGVLCIGNGFAEALTLLCKRVFSHQFRQGMYIPREILRRVSTPQAYKFGKLDWAYHEAFEKEIGIKGSAYTNTMMVELGETLYFAAGSDKNIKLTTKDDLEMFKGYLKKEKDNWLK